MCVRAYIEKGVKNSKILKKKKEYFFFQTLCLGYNTHSKYQNKNSTLNSTMHYLLVYGSKNRQKYWFTLLKQTIEKSIYKDCGEGKVLIRLKIQS